MAFTDYVELRAMSAFSFLRSSSLPEDLVDRAVELGYGAPRFYSRAKKHKFHAMVGADIALENDARLLVLVRNRDGYQNLCKLITNSKAGRKKGESLVTLDDLEAHAAGLLALTDGNFALDRLQGIFRRDLYLEIQRHLNADEERRNRSAASRGVGDVGDDGGHCGSRGDRDVAARTAWRAFRALR